jgi:hypothetical protein
LSLPAATLRFGERAIRKDCRLEEVSSRDEKVIRIKVCGEQIALRLFCMTL